MSDSVSQEKRPGEGWGTAATWIATVGGLGHVPVAPGTWGSLVGLLLGLLLIRALPQPIGLTILAALFLIAVPLCTKAERHLTQHDPRAVILDEVWGMAAILVALPWTAASWRWLVLAFLLFRAFDVLKPPPLGQLARLPGGWGIMADDLGAAAYTALVLILLHRFLR